MSEWLKPILRSDGKLSSRTISAARPATKAILDRISNETAFLPLEATLSERIWCITHQISERPKCCICGDECTFLPNFGVGYSKTCGKPSCKTQESTTKRLATTYKKYGAYASPKARASASARASELYHKGRVTLYEHHGVTNPGLLSGHRKKVQYTLQQRYGVSWCAQIPYVRDHLASKRLETFQNMDSNIVVNSISKRTEDNRSLYEVHYKCLKCGKEQTMNGETFKWRASHQYPTCTECSGSLTGISLAQLELARWISNVIGDVVEEGNRQLIYPKEIDILIPSYNLAVEYDGMFWHSYGALETVEQRKSHLHKTEQCARKGYQLIHIFESEWVEKQDIVKSRLKAILGHSDRRIYARKCQIVELSISERRSFFNQTHIQGDVGAVVSYALKIGDEIVAAMSFGKPRYQKDYQWELLRFSTSLNTTVVGAASKLFNHFQKKHSPENVVSYADRRWSRGKLYDALEFVLTNTSEPSYYYVHTSSALKMIHRSTFQKHKIKARWPDLFDENLTEAENMFKFGYRRIWDCGALRFVWSRT